MSDVKMLKIRTARPGNEDPLYAIFEQHLYNFQDSNIDRKTFIVQVVQDYLTHLRRLKIAIPKNYEPYIIEELSTQVNTMLVKKIYGCFSLDEFREKSKDRPGAKVIRRRPATKLRKAR
jgi:hypothetical protein